MSRWKYNVMFLLLTIVVVGAACAQTSSPALETPPNFKIALFKESTQSIGYYMGRRFRGEVIGTIQRYFYYSSFTR